MSTEKKVLNWASDRNILQGSTPLSQWNKTQEEVEELFEAIEDCNLEEVKDAIGDIMVTLAIQCHFWNLDLKECFDHAYDQIKDRKGRLIDGVFVKEENL